MQGLHFWCDLSGDIMACVQDHVTISFDGQDRDGIFAAVTEKIQKMPGALPGLPYECLRVPCRQSHNFNTRKSVRCNFSAELSSNGFMLNVARNHCHLDEDALEI